MLNQPMLEKLLAMRLRGMVEGAKERGESDDGGRRSDDSYSPRRHRCFRSPTISVGPRFAYRRVMTPYSYEPVSVARSSRDTCCRLRGVTAKFKSSLITITISFTRTV